MSIRVSVIVPVYNVENYLRKCLDSILSQTLDDIEIINAYFIQCLKTIYIKSFEYNVLEYEIQFKICQGLQRTIF